MQRVVAHLLDNDRTRRENLQRVLVNRLRFITEANTLPANGPVERLPGYHQHYLFVGVDERFLHSHVPVALRHLLPLVYTTPGVHLDHFPSFSVVAGPATPEDDLALLNQLRNLAALEGVLKPPYLIPELPPPSVSFGDDGVRGLVENSFGQATLDSLVFQIFPYAQKPVVKHLSQGLSSSVTMRLEFEYDASPGLGRVCCYALKVTSTNGGGARLFKEWERRRTLIKLLDPTRTEFLGQRFPRMFINEDGFQRNGSPGPAECDGWTAAAYQFVEMEGTDIKDMYRLFLEGRMGENLDAWLHGIYELHHLRE
jgi:hypothetical protein